MSDILEELANSPSARPYHQGYEPPTHMQIKALRQHLKLSQTNVGQLCGLHIRPDPRPDKGKFKDCPAVSQWECVNPSRRTTIPYTSWRILLHLAAVAKLENEFHSLTGKSVTHSEL